MSDELDDAIRAELRDGRARPDGDVHGRLAMLAPAMQRARRRRHAAIGSVGAAALVLIGVAALLVPSLLDSTPSQRLVTSDDGESSTTEELDGTDDEMAPPTTRDESRATDREPQPSSEVEESPTTRPATSTTVSTEPASSLVVSEPTTPSTSPPVSVTRPAPTAAPPPVTAPLNTAPLNTAPPSTSPPTTAVPTTAPTSAAPATTVAAPATTSPPTTVATSGTRTIESRCGSISVAFDATSVSLVSTSPRPGFSAVIDSAGPEVDVEFEAGDDDEDSCEISAEIDDGVLDVEIDD